MKNLKGFTLIELLIVIVIIGILAGVVLSVLNPAQAQRKASESVLKANTEKLCLALFSCAATTSDARNCDADAASIGATAPTAPTSAAYTVSTAASATAAVTVTGTLLAGVGSTSSCVFTCVYNFSTGAPTNLAESGTGCLIK